MAVQNCIGDSFRGATWVSLHNGGGVGWGEVMNGECIKGFRNWIMKIRISFYF